MVKQKGQPPDSGTREKTSSKILGDLRGTREPASSLIGKF
jgi:hypothetical protein